MGRLRLSKRYFHTGKPIKTVQLRLTPGLQAFRAEFDDYQGKHYPTVSVECLCGNDNAYLISTADREGWEFPLVICGSCGLIRAKEYWDQGSTIDYYKNWYRKIYGLRKDDDPEPIYHAQVQNKSEKVYNFTKDFTKHFDKPYNVVDIGGAVGEILHHYQKEAKCYLFDYNKRFLQYARDQEIAAIEGGISKLLSEEKIRPDLVLLSHVLEHFTDVHKELDILKSTLGVGALVYVALPGIDSLKRGRRSYDFLGDIHKAHVFYFSTETLSNLMGRHGFECLKSDTEINALYRYTGVQERLINHHSVVVSHIGCAELKRKSGYGRLRRFIGRLLPHSIKNWVRKRFF